MCLLVLACCAVVAGQQNVPSSAGNNRTGLFVPQGKFTAVSEEITLNRPVSAVWAKVGSFCEIRDWAAVVHFKTIVAHQGRTAGIVI